MNAVEDPVKEVEQITTPTAPVPIIGTVTEEDIENAGEYTSGYTCILATMLKRMGYGEKNLIVHPYHAEIDGNHYAMDGGQSDVGWIAEIRSYDRSVVGKQFVFYPMA